jgi:hypothetical protein
MISYLLTPCQHHRKVFIFNDNLINCMGVHGMKVEVFLYLMLTLVGLIDKK